MASGHELAPANTVEVAHFKANVLGLGHPNRVQMPNAADHSRRVCTSLRSPPPSLDAYAVSGRGPRVERRAAPARAVLRPRSSLEQLLHVPSGLSAKLSRRCQGANVEKTNKHFIYDNKTH